MSNYMYRHNCSYPANFQMAAIDNIFFSVSVAKRRADKRRHLSYMSAALRIEIILVRAEAEGRRTAAIELNVTQSCTIHANDRIVTVTPSLYFRAS